MCYKENGWPMFKQLHQINDFFCYKQPIKYVKKKTVSIVNCYEAFVFLGVLQNVLILYAHVLRNSFKSKTVQDRNKTVRATMLHHLL